MIEIPKVDVPDEPAAAPHPDNSIEHEFEVVQSEKISNEGNTPVLYEAWSVLNNFMGCDNASVHWYCMDGFRRRMQYHHLIAHYEKIANNEDDIDYYGEYIDELFSAKEICQLRKYLEQPGKGSVITRRINTPVDIIGKNMDFIWLGGQVMHIIDLTDEKDYNLPFKVWGEYNTYRCPPSITLHTAELKELMQLFNGIFNSMRISVPADDLEKILIGLNDEYGFHANCEFAPVDGSSGWFEKLRFRREPETENMFVKLLLRHCTVEIPVDIQAIVNDIAEKKGIFIVHGNNLSERIKNRQKYMEDLDKEEDAREIADATRGGAIDGDV